MLGKFGLILLILLATLLAFVAGFLLPAGEPPPATPTATSPSATINPTAASGDTTPAEGGAATQTPTQESEADRTGATPYTDLTLPNVLPAKAQLGLQLGLFLDAARADDLAVKTASLGEKTQVLVVTDPNGARWQLLVAGPYATLEEAHTQRLALRRGLGLDHPPAVLLLPPPKQPPAKD